MSVHSKQWAPLNGFLILLHPWWLAIRPKTLIVGVIPVAVGSVLAYRADGFHMPSFYCALLCALLIQIGTNLSNDYFDFVQKIDTNERIGPVRVTQAGLLTPKQVKRAFITTFILAIVSGGYLVQRGGYPIALLGIASIASGIGYTASPHYSLSRTGLADIWVILFFGTIATVGTYYTQTLQWRWSVVYIGTAFGFLALSLLALNNLRDHEQDAKVGKRTLVVRFGYLFGCIEYAFSMLIPFIMFLIFMLYEKFFILIWPIFILFIGSSFCILKLCKAARSEDFLPLLPQTAFVLALFGFAFCSAMLLQ